MVQHLKAKSVLYIQDQFQSDFETIKGLGTQTH